MDRKLPEWLASALFGLLLVVLSWSISTLVQLPGELREASRFREDALQWDALPARGASHLTEALKRTQQNSQARFRTRFASVADSAWPGVRQGAASPHEALQMPEPTAANQPSVQAHMLGAAIDSAETAGTTALARTESDKLLLTAALVLLSRERRLWSRLAEVDAKATGITPESSVDTRLEQTLDEYLVAARGFVSALETSNVEIEERMQRRELASRRQRLEAEARNRIRALAYLALVVSLATLTVVIRFALARTRPSVPERTA